MDAAYIHSCKLSKQEMRSFKRQISHSENTFYFWTCKIYWGLDLGNLIAGYGPHTHIHTLHTHTHKTQIFMCKHTLGASSGLCALALHLLLCWYTDRSLMRKTCGLISKQKAAALLPPNQFPQGPVLLAACGGQFRLVKTSSNKASSFCFRTASIVLLALWNLAVCEKNCSRPEYATHKLTHRKRKGTSLNVRSLSVKKHVSSNWWARTPSHQQVTVHSLVDSLYGRSRVRIHSLDWLSFIRCPYIMLSWTKNQP